MKRFKHKFKGFGIHDSECIVTIKDINGISHILFEDMGVGTSVTNASEQLATEIVNKFNLNPKGCRFFETYGDGVDEIEYLWCIHVDDYKIHSLAKTPKWKACDDNILKEFKI